MSPRKKALLALVLAAMLAGAGVWYLVRQSAIYKEAAKLAEDVEVDVSMRGLTLTQGEEGDVRWRLTAAGAKYLQEQGRIRVDEPRITYYPKDSDQELNVRAPEGEIDQNTEEAWLWPVVHMRSGENAVSSEKLHYIGADRTIVLTGDVVLLRPDMRVDSQSVVVDLAGNRVTATGGVKAVIRKGAGLESK